MGLRVLVIEDEDRIADYLVRGLREEGFSVERAVDGAEGWHHLKTGTWDVILLDWWLLLYYLGSLVVLLGGFSATLYLLAKD